MRWLLTPLAWLYDGITSFRNWLYDSGVCRSYEAEVKTICVGNLSVGGTGKTPHVAYLAELLHAAGKEQIAILSRGYKRKTHGFLLADEKATSDSVGDEPLQQQQNLPYIHVAVDEDRKNGLIHLQQLFNNLSVVLLDDAFQHRAVKAGLSILLTPYDRLFTSDHVLPWGLLRENRRGARRADFIVVTKCQDDMSEQDKNAVYSILRNYSKSDIYFSHLVYGYFKPVFANVVRTDTVESIASRQQRLRILVVTGIAQPEPMYAYLKKQKYEFKFIKFSDHYCFSEKDFVSLQNEMNQGKYDILLTTEKDAARMQTSDVFPDDLKSKTFALPITISFGSDTEKFNHKILSYVG